MNGPGNIIIEDKEITNEQFEVTDKSAHYFLGPNLTLRNCTVILKVPASRLFFDRVRFIECSIEVKQELKNHQQWLAVALKSCRFKGWLRGCDFGHWPEYSSLPGFQFGSIEDCDFTEALMNACRFMGCDPRTLRLPRWPCFTFLEPIRRAPELRRVKWPGLFGDVVVGDLQNEPPPTMATIFHAPTIAKQCETTPEELRAVIEQFDCIVY